MRKTFAVGKLTSGTAKILLVEDATSASARQERILDSLHPTRSPSPKLPDPHTVH
jgi:hypothetical protein